MKTKLFVAAALGGTLLATCLASGSAQATPLPVLKSDASPIIVTLVGRGGRGGFGGISRGGFGGISRGHIGGMSRGHIGSISRGHVGGWSGKAYRSYGGVSHYAYKGGALRHYGDGVGKYRDYGKRYAYKGHDHRYYDRHKRYGHYGKYRRYGYYGWYGWPYISYSYYGGGCGWLYRRAVATGSPYWWNRYYECIGYY